jgi:D-alanyl-lipoteichoic acid acyltransferase DltB (MBOAT superfamily)
MAFIPIYLVILLFTILVDYWAARFIEKAEGPKRKWFLWVSLAANISVLTFFKYYFFLNSQLEAFLSNFMVQSPLPLVKFILPVGLSFHTFQAMSYTIEVYWRK